MTREQAINYLFSSGFTHEQVGEVVRALTYEPTTKNNLGVDCISRIETIDYLCKHCPDDGECFKDCDEIKHLRQMPSVTPQEPFINKPCVSSGVCEHDKNKVIDSIRAEIEQLSTSTCTETRKIYINADDFKENVLAIFDKYKAESGDEE